MQHLLLMPRSGEISAEAVSLSTGVPHKGWVRYLRGQNNFKVFLKEGEIRLKMRVQEGGPEEAERTTLLLYRPAGGHWNSGRMRRKMRAIGSQNLKGQNF